MSLRRRLVVLCVAAVAIAVAGAAAVSYVAVRNELRGQVDEVLTAQARALGAINLREGPFRIPLGELPADVEPPLQPPGDVGVIGQVIRPDGTVQAPIAGGEPRLAVTDEDLAIAASGAGRFLVDVEVEGEPYRVLTVAVPGLGAAKIGRSLAGVEGVLADLRILLGLLAAGGIAIAAALAWIVSRRVMAPIASLTEAAEHVSETEDLSMRIPASGGDELGRLAGRFNAMLETIERSRAELASSVGAQRQLVADASHELRTPVASLRTDVESMLQHPELSAEERTARLGQAELRLEELTALIADVIELARGDERVTDPEEVRFDTVVEEAVERMRGLAPEHRFRVDLEPTVIAGEPDRIARAINNLLDNARKYSPAAEPIDVSLAGGVLTVRDRGPGVPPEELEHVFDRFYRGRHTREQPGSGLGLAIVSQVARAGGGEAWAEEAQGGGAAFHLRFRVLEPVHA